MDLARIAEAVRSVAADDAPTDEKLRRVCELLRDEVAHYDWVGFYLVPRDAPGELQLGPYAGAPTEHTRIRFGQGICGQAAEREQAFVVQDVSKESNYLSCSIHVKSEIVVPVMRRGEVSGEIDIDSHQVSPFTGEDTELLEEIARIVEPLI